MLTSSYFTIGTSHMVCEDYALAGNGYSIISDGCSNAGGPRIDTDWGARILAKALEEQLVVQMPPTDWSANVLSVAKTQIRNFPNLPFECLTATLGTVYQTATGATAWLVGDGVVMARRRDGKHVFHHVEFLPGGERNHPAPFYLRYLNKPVDAEHYFHLFGGRVKITSQEGNLLGDQETFSYRESQRQLTTESYHFVWDFPAEEYEYVMVGSDGLASFYTFDEKGRNKPITLTGVLRYLLDFPDYNPGFFLRQCQWVFKQDKRNTFRRLNWHNYDDVSLGIITLAKPEGATSEPATEA